MTDIWTPPTGVTLLPFRRCVEREEIRVLPNGERVRVHTDDSGTVTHVEHNHTLDAIVRPNTVTFQIRNKGAQ